MNREIKFRAWNKNFKKMYKIGQITLEKGIWDYVAENREFIGMSIPYQPNFVLMQFTGLHDKNGKEIYEGDIVKIHGHSYDYGLEKDKTGQIKFLDGAFGFYREKTKNEYYFYDLSTENGYGELEYYEVIRKYLRKPRIIRRRIDMITTITLEILAWLFVESEEEQNLPTIFFIPLLFLNILLLIAAVPLDIVLFPIEAVISLIYIFIRKDK